MGMFNWFQPDPRRPMMPAQAMKEDPKRAPVGYTAKGAPKQLNMGDAAEALGGEAGGERGMLAGFSNLMGRLNDGMFNDDPGRWTSQDSLSMGLAMMGAAGSPNGWAELAPAVQNIQAGIRGRVADQEARDWRERQWNLGMKQDERLRNAERDEAKDMERRNEMMANYQSDLELLDMSPAERLRAATTGQVPASASGPLASQIDVSDPTIRRRLADARVAMAREGMALPQQQAPQRQDLPSGMMYDDAGNPVWAPNYLEGQAYLKSIGSGGQGPAQYRTLTPDEVQSVGLPQGTLAQIDSNGKVSIVQEGSGGTGGPSLISPMLAGAEPGVQSRIIGEEMDVIAEAEEELGRLSNLATKTQQFEDLSQNYNANPLRWPQWRPMGKGTINDIGQTFSMRTSDLEQITSELTPLMRPPGSGTMSDGDREMFEQATVNINNRPGTNRRIQATAQASRDNQEAYINFLRDWQNTNGFGTQGQAQQVWMLYSNQNPVFDQETGMPVQNRVPFNAWYQNELMQSEIDQLDAEAARLMEGAQ